METLTVIYNIDFRSQEIFRVSEFSPTPSKKLTTSSKQIVCAFDLFLFELSCLKRGMDVSFTRYVNDYYSVTLGESIVALETPFVGGWNNIFLCTGRGSVSRRRVLTFLMDSILFCYVNVDFITIYLFFRVS